VAAECVLASLNDGRQLHAQQAQRLLVQVARRELFVQPAPLAGERDRSCEQTPARVSGDCRGGDMLWTIVVILAVLWLLGMVGSYTMGGLLHVPLFLAIAIVLINVIQGRRTVL